MTSFFQIDASDLKTIFDHLCECMMNPYFSAKEAQWLKKNLDEHAAVMNSYEQFLRSQRERNRKNHCHPEPFRSYKDSVSYKTHEAFFRRCTQFIQRC